MKKESIIIAILVALISINTADAQIWKKLQKKAEDKIAKKADEKIDDVLKGKKKTKKTKEEEEEHKTSKEEKTISSQNENGVSTSNNSAKIWRNYKFIPGEKVIFLDDLKFEEVGEFPSRWDLASGGAEVAMLNNEKVILATAQYHNKIMPLFDKKNYLSDEFTIEFDIYVDNFTKEIDNIWSDYHITLREHQLKNRSSNDIKFSVSNNGVSGYAISNDFSLEEVPVGKLNAWHHIALSYNKGKLKMYYDETRILNLPRVDIKPDIFVIDFNSVGKKDLKITPAIKNIRIAHGGGQMYKRIVAEGKYVTNGILFDSGKATIKQQSMGIINKVVTVMNENPGWKFQIIGHTDSDGDIQSNLILSQQRAEAVKKALVYGGINIDRITTLGKGESAPINGNSNPEEKANNRRVEFIKS